MKLVTAVRTELQKSGLSPEQVEAALPSTLGLSALYVVPGVESAQMFAAILVTFGISEQAEVETAAGEIEDMSRTTTWGYHEIARFFSLIGAVPSAARMTLKQVIRFAGMVYPSGSDNAAQALRHVLVATAAWHEAES